MLANWNRSYWKWRNYVRPLEESENRAERERKTLGITASARATMDGAEESQKCVYNLSCGYEKGRGCVSLVLSCFVLHCVPASVCVFFFFCRCRSTSYGRLGRTELYGLYNKCNRRNMYCAMARHSLPSKLSVSSLLGAYAQTASCSIIGLKGRRRTEKAAKQWQTWTGSLKIVNSFSR